MPWWKRTVLWGLLAGAWLAPAQAQQNLVPVQIYTFSADGAPLRGVEAVVAGQVYRSDPEGRLGFSDVPGVREYTLTWQGREAARVRLSLRIGGNPEVLVTVQPEEAPVVTVGEEGEAAPAPPEATPVVAAPGARGRLRGTAVHLETHKPVAGATLLFRGTTLEARTDARGEYAVELPAGTYTFSLIHADFATQTREAEVLAGGETVVDWELTPSAFQMEALRIVSTEEIQVLGGLASLNDETKNSGVVLNLLGSEQISKSGDSDAAGALGRVTGLTVVGGKYVYVRGMGERYSSSYMNGARLPSPELDRRVVPLDLFPTAVIESLAIQKTYSPELYGDFSGGAVTIRTLGVPADRFARRLRGSVSFSLGFDPDTLFQTVDFQKTSALDWLGYDDGSRRLPGAIDPDRPVNEEQFAGDGGYTPDQMTALGRTFPNTWAPEKKLIWPDLSLGFTLRDKYDLTRTDHLGWSMAVLYKHSMGVDAERERLYGDIAGLNLAYDTLTTSDSQEVDWSALANVEYERERVLNLRSTTLFTRITNDDWALTTGRQKEIADERIYEASWVEQTLFNQMFGGGVQFTLGIPVQLKGQYSFSLASRYEPDHRLIGYGLTDSGAFDVTNKAGKTYRLYLGADDVIHDVSGSVTLPFPFLGEPSDQILLGGQFIRQDRRVKNNRYTFDYRGTVDTTAPLETILDPSQIDNGSLNAVKFYENTKPSDNYVGTHTVWAGYGNLDLLWFNLLRANLGLRVEGSTQIIDTYRLGTVAKVPELVVLETVDLLPSLNLTLPLGRQFQARLAASKTVNRPDFLELSNTIKEGLPGQGLFRGNPNLVRAEILNADVRLEQYFNPTETWSVGAFYKDFTNPIEVTEATGSSGEKTPVNIPKAFNLGVELEWNLTLGGLADGLREGLLRSRSGSVGDFFWARTTGGFWGNLLRDLTTSGNLSWILSQIDYQGSNKGNNTSAQRPLQGQSPYVVNLSLGYKNSQSWFPDVRSDTGVTLSYNVFGPRIKKIGTGSALDSYEQPFHQLDLVVKHRFNEVWSVDLKVKNLLDPLSVEKQGDLVIQEKHKGRTISIGGKYEF